MYAACEGHFTSSMGTVTKVSDTQYTVVITVKPTTAYVGDNMSGKLTVYCPYYGNTGIGQLNLTAEGSASLGVTSKEGNDTKVTIEVGSNETPGTGERLTVKAMHDDGTPVAWLHMGAPATKSDGKITQELKLDEYILAAEEASNASPRECTIAIYSPSGREVGRQRIVQNPIINLASKESANCYIISSPGRYMLPAQKGNSTQKVWSTRPSNESLTFVNTDTDDKKNTVAYVGMHNDNIVFDVTNETITNGNTVMALKNGNTTLWSWHLWFNEADNRADDENLLDSYPDSKSSKVMNRALGATTYEGFKYSSYDLSYWEDGFFYQWGRKDPLVVQTPQTNGTYINSVENPSVMYSDWNSEGAGWTSDKSVNDPCPPGYKVPTSAMWSEVSSSPGLSLENIVGLFGTIFPYNVAISEDLSQNIVYPYAGYLNAKGELQGAYKKTVEYDDSGFTFTGAGVETGEKVKATAKVLGRTITVELPAMAQDFFYDLDIVINLSCNQGGIWSTDAQLLYEHGALDISSLSIDAFRDAVDIISFKQKRRSLTEYELNVTSVIPLKYTTTEKWSEYVEVSNPSMSDADKLSLLSELYKQGGIITDTKLLKQSINKPQGLQVRCVKE